MKLESDEEPEKSEPAPAPILKMESPKEEEEEKVPPITPMSASEEKPNIAVSQTTTAPPKAAPRSSRDEDKVLTLLDFCTQNIVVAILQGCGNTMPELSDLVPFHSGQIENFYLLILGQVQMYKVNTILYFIF